MAWRPLTEAAALLEGFNPSEQSQLASAQDSDGFADILTSTILEARGCVAAAGSPGDLDADVTSVPDRLWPHVIALARWRWLIAFPNFPQMQTDARKLAAEAAEELFQAVANGETPMDVADDTVGTGGSWATDTKLTGRMAQTRVTSDD